ncbi:3-oxoacyl-[acyl-carrier protein] reductase/enoyl-[acyl-carrier protein] reductase III [Propionibacterium cyclohexanicum]|uniref:3-oxoacyl-[acyl-carrier protein] reductase/enoyl-[acyl-carrier protein] reductase III n=1 Tax=Propionibacterium cyclohexanicum TaxID=64702 RepID=A0A1H9SN99_9ACTN|nr:SDR family oxidoreductase [Propionibacterium cyclohexanicum]SER86384.1 3-oxoacyl-[acyl-carrier protein] reductase/enoyl-[acyl-carrier protein] reductase III [Propionibacterium cyclohexanicum]
MNAPRVAVITGSSRGIGKVLALRLARRGVEVVVNYKANAELAEQTLEEVRAAGSDGLTVQADIETVEGVEALFDSVTEHYPRIDAFVSNAAASAFKAIDAIKPHHIERSFDMNVRPFILGTQRAVRLMPDGGRIVVVTSYGSSRAFPTYALLGAAKAADEALVRYMATEYGPRGVTVNAVNGGLIDTDSLDFFYHRVPGMAPMESVIEKIPLRRPGKAEDMAAAVDFLLSQDAGYISGQVIHVDGGLTVVAPPYWSDTSSPLRDAVERPSYDTQR